MLVEIRSTGCQTIAPPSIHEGTNEPIEWENENALPAHTDATILHQAVKRLVAEVKRRLRVTTCSTSSVPPVTGEQKEQCADTNDSRDDPRNPIEKEQARQRCLRHMQVIRPYHNKDGSHRVFAYCCRGVEHDLTCDETIELIRQVVQSKPLPKQWSDHEIAKRYADAEGKCHRGIALLPSRHVPFPVHCDETTGKPILSARRTLSTAKGFLQTNYMRENDPLLIHFAGDWYRWAGNRYQVVDEITLQDQMLQYLHDALVESNKPGIAPFPFPANPRNAAAGLQTLRGIVHLSDISQQPSWLDANHAIHPANELLAFKSHLYHIPSSQILSPTPRLFNTHALDIELDEIDQVPVKWLEFLSQVFPDSLGSVALLQEWFGYCLTPDTSLQKMLLMCGPPRSGKGTIARVLEQLIGKQYTASPSVDSFTHIFGL
ncbi:MAG TPA: hypothetical protein PLX97_12870, partial [Gemmatales bacterium]|nr:hypothetical protein [Gemmatales bacterium]